MTRLEVGGGSGCVRLVAAGGRAERRPDASGTARDLVDAWGGVALVFVDAAGRCFADGWVPDAADRWFADGWLPEAADCADVCPAVDAFARTCAPPGDRGARELFVEAGAALAAGAAFAVVGRVLRVRVI
jgi:hypothetical protein